MNDEFEPDDERDEDDAPLSVDRAFELPYGAALAYFDQWKDMDEE